MKTEEGEKREVRAERFGRQWRVQSKLRHDERWTYHDEPLLEDLIELRDIVFKKYQRKRLPWDDVAQLDQMLKERGYTVPPEDDEAED